MIVLLFIGRTGLLTGIGIRGGVGLGGIAAYQCGNAPCNETQHQQDQYNAAHALIGAAAVGAGMFFLAHGFSLRLFTVK